MADDIARRRAEIDALESASSAKQLLRLSRAT